MTKPTDIRVVGVRLYFLPIRTRMPLKFGTQTSTSVTCARCVLQVVDRQRRKAVGWGETPLRVQWVWPSSVPYEVRHDALKQFTIRLAESWAKYSEYGHPMEVGYDFQEQVLPGLLDKFNAERGAEPMPWLGALVACSLFDVALHDAYGEGLGRP